MKKILLIIPWVPYPLTSGGNQAFFNMVDYIRHKMSVSVLFGAWRDEQDRIDELKRLWQNVDFYVFHKELELETEQSLVPKSFYYKWLNKTKSSIERKMKRQIRSMQNGVTGILDNDIDFMREKSVLSCSIFRGFNAKYVDYVAKVASSGFDIIQIEFFELIALGYILPKNVQTIFVHHELRYIRNKNEMALFKNIEPDDLMHFFIAKDFEWNALRKFKHIIVLTEVDRKLMTEFIGRKDRIYASPAVVQLNPDTNIEFIPCTQKRFTFVGYGEHYPNLDAVVWFCKEIAPYLRQRGFEFTFQVAGMRYEPYINEFKTVCPEIELVGFVEHLDTFLQGSIALVPIRIGSGMRMKILDMASSNIPFITTSKGLEGIHFANGEECLIANNAADFADSMIQLSSNVELQKKLVDHAYIKLKELYNSHEMLERRMSVYTSILNSKQAIEID